MEALSIVAAIKHFESTHNTCLLTDSKPCVQAVEKLCRGEFSASPPVTSFLSTVSKYQINVRHLNSSVNIPSDFASRNASEYTEPRCQICSFITQLEDSLVRSVHVQDSIASEDPPESIRISFAADILKRDGQLILFLRKAVTS